MACVRLELGASAIVGPHSCTAADMLMPVTFQSHALAIQVAQQNNGFDQLSSLDQRQDVVAGTTRRTPQVLFCNVCSADVFLQNLFADDV